MHLGTLRNWLVIAAAAVTVPSATFAATWDATTGFNQTASNTGVWTYGTTTVTNTNWESTALDANGYAFAADTYSTPTFGGGSWAGSGFAWAKSATGNTEWGNNGEPLAWVSVLTSGGGWVFDKPGLYVQPYAIGNNQGVSGDATVIRWTAPETGTFDVTGSVKGLNSEGLVDQLIKTAADGTRTVLHSNAGAPLALNGTDVLDEQVSLVAGETLDLITYQSPVFKRTYGFIDLQIGTASVPEPAGAGVTAIGAAVALRRRRTA